MEELRPKRVHVEINAREKGRIPEEEPLHTLDDHLVTLPS